MIKLFFISTFLIFCQEELKIGKEQKIINSTYPETDITVAVNPLDSSNIVVTFLQHILNNDTNSYNAPVYYTTNSGVNWNRAFYTFFPNEEYRTILNANPPLVEFNNEGLCHLVWNFDMLKRMPTEPDSIINNTVLSVSNSGKDWSEIVQIERGSWGLNSTQLFRGKTEEVSNFNLINNNTGLRLYYLINNTQRVNTLAYLDLGGPDNRKIDSVSFNEFSLIDNFDFKVYKNRIYSVFEGINNEGSGIFFLEYSDLDTTINFVSESVFLGGSNGLSSEILIIEGLNISHFSMLPQLSIAEKIHIAWTATGLNEQEEFHKVYYSSSNINQIDFDNPIQLVSDQNVSDFNVSLGTILDDVYFSFYSTIQNLLDSQEVYIDYNLKTLKDPRIILYDEQTNLNLSAQRNFNYGIGFKNEIVFANDQIYIFGVDGRDGNGNLEVYINQLPVDIFEFDYSEVVDLQVKSSIYRSNILEMEIISERSIQAFIRIYDNSGRVVTSLENYKFLVGSNKLNIDLPNLSKGAYFLQIKSDNINFTYPFIL